MQKNIGLAQKAAQWNMSFIKSGNKRSLWYCVRRRNNPRSGMLKFWKVCKSRKFRPSINLQSTKKTWKNSMWAGSGYRGLVNSLFAALQAPETGIWGCRCSVSPEGGTMTWPGLMGRPDTRLGHGKHGVTKEYLLLRKMLSSVDGTQKQWAGTRSNGWVRGKAKGNREFFQLETGRDAGRRGIILPISLKSLHAEVCSIWVTVSTTVCRNRDIALMSISPW